MQSLLLRQQWKHSSCGGGVPFPAPHSSLSPKDIVDCMVVMEEVLRHQCGENYYLLVRSKSDSSCLGGHVRESDF